MHRIGKLLWMIFIFWMVFFIICDEKWYKIDWQDNHIVFNEIEKKSDTVENYKFEPQVNQNLVYKNSDLIQINYEFQNPRTLRYGAGIDKERLAKLKDEKKIEEKIEKKRQKTNTWQNDLVLNDYSDISSFFEWLKNQEDAETKEDKEEFENKIDNSIKEIHTWSKINNETVINRKIYLEEQLSNTWFEAEDEGEKIILYYPVERYYHNTHVLKLKKGKEIENDVLDMKIYTWKTFDQGNIDFPLLKEYVSYENDYEPNEEKVENDINQDALYKVEKYEYKSHLIDVKKAEEAQTTSQNNISEGASISVVDKSKTINTSTNAIETPVNLVKVEKYQLKKHPISLKKWLPIEHKFSVEETESSENWLSNSMLENLLKNEEIDINTLESENDEFLQEIFAKTKDINIMNLIVETYLNEYQFVKAKKFIERLPESYRSKLKPSLNLRVAFNSFPLSSKTFSEDLTSLILDYSSKNEISTEDKNRYLWILALMNQNYDKFFELSKWFTSAKNKWFAVKLQWYKDQISKQMWMPAYYFDTLVALELFNQWLFQPAKVLALYSLQQNSNYILPYQVLAYANFLTNSRDTANEYLKKLVDLDPTNAEKYRFLMWVASYRNGKYEQSVVMLSLVKNDNLRLDAQRYLINNYLQLRQNNKLISSRNKLLWYKNLVASDFYTYFYEVFFRPYSEWSEFTLYALDTELANKMLRVCTINLPKDESVVCTYGTIGRNIALWQFNWIEQYLLNLVAEYPQWYLYQALGDYYIQQWDLDKAKTFLLKAVSLTQKRKEVNQIKKLLQETM